MVRGRRSRLYDLIRWIERNRWLKETNWEFTQLALKCGVAGDKPVKRLVQLLKDRDLGGIKIEIREETYTKHDRSTYVKTYVHFNPPGSREEGYWLLFPFSRAVLEDLIALARRRELVRRWPERTRLPIVRAILGWT